MEIPKSESKMVEFKMAFNQDVIVSLVTLANGNFVRPRRDGVSLPKKGGSSQKILGLLRVDPYSCDAGRV